LLAAQVVERCAGHTLRVNGALVSMAGLDSLATLGWFDVEVRDLLASFEIFDVGNIDRARILAKQLRDAPASPNAANEAARSALELRNRICQLLYQKMKLVRDAAGFVFQDYPEVRRLATSAYLRRQRSAARRAKTNEPAAPVGSMPTED
jgi:hypothetical protein